MKIKQSARGRLTANQAERVHSLGQKGLAVTKIARRLRLPYGRVYYVLKRKVRRASRGVINAVPAPPSFPATSLRPPLSVEAIVRGGFVLSSCWTLSDADDLLLDRCLPVAAGVYAFAKEGTVLYVGLTTNDFSKRLRFYGKPGLGQSTNLRLKVLLLKEPRESAVIEIYTATPPNLEWNGLLVHGGAGLEHSLITEFSLPWNVKWKQGAVG